jgi:hypothetical protein
MSPTCLTRSLDNPNLKDVSEIRMRYHATKYFTKITICLSNGHVDDMHNYIEISLKNPGNQMDLIVSL